MCPYDFSVGHSVSGRPHRTECSTEGNTATKAASKATKIILHPRQHRTEGNNITGHRRKHCYQANTATKETQQMRQHCTEGNKASKATCLPRQPGENGTQHISQQGTEDNTTYRATLIPSQHGYQQGTVDNTTYRATQHTTLDSRPRTQRALLSRQGATRLIEVLLQPLWND